MPVLKGAMGYSRFLVKGGQALSSDVIAEKLNMFKFRPLHPKGEDTETVGWCPYLSEYDYDKSIEVKDFMFDRKIILSLRMDAISLPKELLKSLVKKSIAAYAKDYNKFPDRTVRKEIELAEALGLRARVLPKTKIIESIWCQNSEELRVFSRSKAQVDRYLELFQQTFMLRPERRDFAFEALQMAEKDGQIVALEALTHQPIFIPPVRVDIQ